MNFVLYTAEPDGTEATSSALRDLSHALDFARTLIADGVKVARIVSPDGEITPADEIEAWCVAHPERKVVRRLRSEGQG